MFQDLTKETKAFKRGEKRSNRKTQSTQTSDSIMHYLSQIQSGLVHWD